MVTSVPDQYRCPISMRIMAAPVAVQHAGDEGVGRVAHIYSRHAINLWMMTARSTCPLDERAIVQLIPQLELQQEIREFVATHPEALHEDGSEDDDFVEAYNDSIRSLVQIERRARRDLLGEAEMGRLGIICPFVIQLPAHRDQILARRAPDMDRWGRSTREFIGEPLDALADQAVMGMPMTVILKIQDPHWIREMRVNILAFESRVEESYNQGGTSEIELEIGQGALEGPDLMGFRPLSEVPNLLQPRRRPLHPTRCVTVALRAQDAGVTVSHRVFLVLTAACTAYVATIFFLGYLRLRRF